MAEMTLKDWDIAHQQWLKSQARVAALEAEVERLFGMLSSEVAEADRRDWVGDNVPLASLVNCDTESAL